MKRISIYCFNYTIRNTADRQKISAKESIKTIELYETEKERLLTLGNNITIQPKKQTIGFKINKNSFCDLVFQKTKLKAYLNLKSGELQDEKNITRDVSNVGHWGNGAYEIQINDLDDTDYIISLFKQSLRKNKGNMA